MSYVILCCSTAATIIEQIFPKQIKVFKLHDASQKCKEKKGQTWGSLRDLWVHIYKDGFSGAYKTHLQRRI